MRTAIQQLSYILILLTIFSSCNKDNEKEIIEESYEMNIKVEYTKWSESYPDEGSKIYIYFNRQMEDFTAMKQMVYIIQSIKSSDRIKRI